MSSVVCLNFPNTSKLKREKIVLHLFSHTALHLSLSLACLVRYMRDNQANRQFLDIDFICFVPFYALENDLLLIKDQTDED